MKIRWTWIALGLGVLVVASAGFSQVRRVEEPKFSVISREGDFELRDYPSIIVAEAFVVGEREVAINQGFRLIADYIFGNNTSAEKVAMTAPVKQQAGETVAMTAPVTQQQSGNAWVVRFIMPSKYSIETLPKPNNPSVSLKPVDGQRVAVLRFSGVADDEVLSKKTEQLTAILGERGLKALALPTFAFYDPPWTLGLFRRNEVMIAVGK